MTTPALPDADPAAYAEFVAGTSLQEINWHRLHAERTSGEELASFDIQLQPEYGLAPDQSSVVYRYNVVVDMKAPEGASIGTVEVVLAMRFDVAAPPDDSVLNRFGATSGLFMAFPYLRESVQSLAARLGIPGLIIQVLKGT